MKTQETIHCVRASKKNTIEEGWYSKDDMKQLLKWNPCLSAKKKPQANSKYKATHPPAKAKDRRGGSCVSVEPCSSGPASWFQTGCCWWLLVVGFRV